jgi:hypothetical protein
MVSAVKFCIACWLLSLKWPSIFFKRLAEKSSFKEEVATIKAGGLAIITIGHQQFSLNNFYGEGGDREALRVHDLLPGRAAGHIPGTRRGRRHRGSRVLVFLPPGDAAAAHADRPHRLGQRHPSTPSSWSTTSSS